MSAQQPTEYSDKAMARTTTKGTQGPLGVGSGKYPDARNRTSAEMPLSGHGNGRLGWLCTLWLFRLGYAHAAEIREPSTAVEPPCLGGSDYCVCSLWRLGRAA